MEEIPVRIKFKSARDWPIVCFLFKFYVVKQK